MRFGFGVVRRGEFGHVRRPANVASIGPGGLAQALLVGTSKITATTESIVGTAALTVSNAKLMSITVTPPDPTLPQSFREQLTATGNFNDSTHQDLTDSVDWVSSDSSVATVGNASGAKGVTTGVAAGTAEISATFNAVVGKTDVKVTDATLTSVAVTPTTPKLALNQKLNFTATGTFSDKTTKDLTDDATWSSSDAAKATEIALDDDELRFLEEPYEAHPVMGFDPTGETNEPL